MVNGRNYKMPTQNSLVQFVKRQPLWRLLVLFAVVAAAGSYWYRGTHRADNKVATFAARRGPLNITVVEGGSLAALESQEAKCEVRSPQGTKILKIVEEGYIVTEDDVKNGKVLVELDSSGLQQQIVQGEVAYQNATAALTDAQQAYEIQLNQNQSDTRAAEQKTRFARMDFDKFLGDAATTELLAKLGLDKILAAATTNDLNRSTRTATPSVAPAASAPTAAEMAALLAQAQTRAAAAAATSTAARSGTPSAASALMNLTAEQLAMLAQAQSRGGSAAIPADQLAALTQALAARGASAASAPVSAPTAPTSASPSAAPAPSFEIPALGKIDFAPYANAEVLGDGETKQKLRKFQDDLQIANKELAQTLANAEGTRKLFEKDFATKNDLQRDELAAENGRLKVQTATTARDLFLKYEFPKSAEQMLSAYLDAVRELDKARRLAISRLAQADARLSSARGQHQVQTKNRADLQDQLTKCIIKAQKAGLVVYGSGQSDMMYYGPNQEPIREGTTVRERQAIFTIPDLSKMSVSVKIYETYIKKVKKGQKVRITVDAFPDNILDGEVTKVGLLPDSQNRYLNPDLKVYATTITITGTQDWIKPGMTAKAEILVDKLDNVIHVPVQAVSPSDGKQVCYVMLGSVQERREVEIGEFNDEFIEIKNGLKEGERVLLRAPQSSGSNPPGGGTNTPAKETETSATPSQPAAPAGKV